MNIAFFGGSFDPPHLGHDSIVKMALSELDIDKLIIMPTFISPFKSQFSAPPELRLKWVKKLWGELKRVEILDFEIKQERPVPTIQSVKYIYETYDISEFYLIIGADHISSLDKWHDIAKLRELTKIIVAERDHIIIPCEFKKMDIHVNVSSSQIRQELASSQIPEVIKDDVIKFYKGNR
ncbi:nicotinate (nicotinamide) nucleotide adenylyltransferase [Campylobacter suis]|uniref:Probable nicotinate-nucleotide adenylyltransferase n=1 Tax=Campylobacter suis TaxID=2790657 RepID=A0ABN7K6W7_9BACT|nr:nicotinate (nicotinamide) nucleotide adenylyltransferase [Campylobacter suis]CAD7286417.1 putative nicotinate-nucleotide adenylyltransferase [Campylobacter suis]